MSPCGPAVSRNTGGGGSAGGLRSPARGGRAPELSRWASPDSWRPRAAPGHPPAQPVARPSAGRRPEGSQPYGLRPLLTRGNQTSSAATADQQHPLPTGRDDAPRAAHLQSESTCRPTRSTAAAFLHPLVQRQRCNWSWPPCAPHAMMRSQNCRTSRPLRRTETRNVSTSAAGSARHRDDPSLLRVSAADPPHRPPQLSPHSASNRRNH